MAIIHALYKKQRSSIYIILCVACIIFPFLGSAFNGFNYSSNKWLAANCLVLSICVVQLLSDKISKKEGFILTFVTIFFLVFNIYINTSGRRLILLAGTVSLCVLWGDIVFRRFEGRELYTFIIILVCIVPMGYAWNKELKNVENEYMPLSVLTTPGKYYWDTNDAQLIKKMEGNPIDGFYRFTGDIRYNSGITDGMSSTSAYWSILDKGYMAFYNELAIIENKSYNQVKGVDNRSALFYLSNSRYSVSTKNDLPYGLIQTSIGRIHKSRDSLPFGYSYESVISYENMLDKNPLEKELIMLEGAVVERETGIKAVPEDVVPAIIKLQHSLICNDDIIIEKNKISVLKDGGILKLIVNPSNNSGEYGLYIEGLSTNKSVQEMPIEIAFFHGDTLLTKKQLIYTTSSSNWYSDRHNFYISSGYQESGVDHVELIFAQSSDYEIEELSLLLYSDYKC